MKITSAEIEKTYQNCAKFYRNEKFIEQFSKAIYKTLVAEKIACTEKVIARKVCNVLRDSKRKKYQVYQIAEEIFQLLKQIEKESYKINYKKRKYGPNTPPGGFDLFNS